MINENEIIGNLEEYNSRLKSDVIESFKTKGREFGMERFDSWKKKFYKFLEVELPGESEILKKKLILYSVVSLYGMSAKEKFLRNYGNKVIAFIDSLILDISNDDYEEKVVTEKIINKTIDKNTSNNIFIVHGHDGELKEQVARLLDKLNIIPIILHEQPSAGKTIIEKIEKYSETTNFAIILYTPDDLTIDKDKDKVTNYRARQNVILEHGFLMGKIGRSNIMTLVKGEIELPSDISGIVYIDDKNWRFDLAKELIENGFEINVNQIL